MENLQEHCYLHKIILWPDIMLQYPVAHVIIYSVCLEQEKAQRQIDGFSREQFSVQAAFKYIRFFPAIRS